MLDKNKVVIKGSSSGIAGKKSFEIVDAESSQPVGSATENTTTMAMLLGMVLGKDNMSLTIEFRQKSDNALVFSVRRKGFIFKKIQALDAQGQVIGSYKAKMFSLSGGFHVYDKDGKHFADIKGKMFKAEYKFVTPDGTTEMGSVSKSWAGMAKALFTGGQTYGVEIAPAYAGDQTAKMLILGAAVAINALFTKAKSSSGGSSSSEEGGGGGEE